LEASMQALTNKIDNNAQTLNDAMEEVSQKISDIEERINNAIDDKIAGLKEELKKDLTS
jgi:archaellum component FlaC